MSIFSPCSSAITARTRCAHRADAGALGVDPGHVGLHRDLGAVPRLAGQRRDLDGAVGDLGDLEREQLAHQVRVRPRQADLRTLAARACTLTTKQRSRSPCTYFSPGTCSASGSTPSIVPRSTSTLRGSRPCWMTPAMTSPSWPRKSPMICSSSTSRRRCTITWRAVDGRDPAEAGRGVVELGPGLAALALRGRGSPSSRAQTTTCPVLRSSSTRAQPVGTLGAVVGHEHRLLDRGDEHVQGDVALALQARSAARSMSIRSSSSSVPRANSTCTWARSMSAYGMCASCPGRPLAPA